MSKQIHRCTSCGHQADDHCRERVGGQKHKVGPCSMGGCACTRTISEVTSSEPVETIPTVPAYDHATGRWATRSEQVWS